MILKPSVSIGIPAHNEEGGICDLLKGLVEQYSNYYSLKEIYVFVDGCTDQTSSVVNQFAKDHHLVTLYDDGKRVGKPARINQFFTQSNSDIAVVLDADVLPTNSNFLDHLIKPFIDDSDVSYVSGKASPNPPKTSAEQVSLAMFHVWEKAVENSHQEVYHSEGSVRAFRRNLYTKMRFPTNTSADDVFPYLYCVTAGYKFFHAKTAIVKFCLPSSWADYFKVSSRYLQSISIQRASFPDDVLAKHLTVTSLDKIYGLFKEFIHNPFWTLIYSLTIPIPRVLQFIDRAGRSSKWDSARSTKKNPKRRLVISTYDDLTNPHYGGGGALAIHSVAKELNNYYDLTIVTSCHSRQSSDQIIEGVRYKRIGFTPDLCPPLGQLFYVLSLPLAALTIKHDLWLESFTPPFSASLLPLFTSKPVIALVHMLSGQEMKRKYHLPFDFVENVGLKLYKKFLVMSSASAHQIKQLHPGAILHTIPNGVDLPNLDSTPKLKQICFVGRIDLTQKGLDLLIEAFSKIAPLTKWNLVIAGSGPNYELDTLKRLIKNSGVSNRIKLVGRVDNLQRDKLYKQSSLLVIPSRYETFCLVGLEGLAYGLPMVHFKIPGLSWLPKGGSLSLPEFSSDDLATVMIHLIDSPIQRKQMSETNLRESFKYSWSQIATQYRSFIESQIQA